MTHMQRREFITLLSGTTATWPLAARAQQRTMPVIGFLGGGAANIYGNSLANFRRGLADIGYTEGRNVAIEYRWAEDHNDRLPVLVADLVRRRVAVIVIADNTTSALAAKAATQTIPIVFSIGADPVEIGLVASLSRPGGNITGVSNLQTTTFAKRLQLLHEVLPAANLIAFIANPTNPTYAETEIREAHLAAGALGVRLLILNAKDQSEIETAFATLLEQQAGALVVSADILFNRQQDQIITLAARHRIPAIYPYITQTRAGGLMSYGNNSAEGQHIIGVYTGRILKGEKPANLPVQQVTKIQLVINMKTAKVLGLTFPTALLVRADEVIE
jgi:putative tryptophan/tyrosine transport system substrate-binding protein